MSKLQEVVDYFIEIRDPDVVVYQRYLRAGKNLLILCDNNVERAKKCLDWTKEWVTSFGGEDFQIETTLKKFLEIKA